ncbi:hypothetical protein C3L33_20847, partial [Rhododendron williamsianum]
MDMSIRHRSLNRPSPFKLLPFHLIHSLSPSNLIHGGVGAAQLVPAARRDLSQPQPKVETCTMDNIVDSLNNAYQDFVAAAASVLEAKETSSGQKTAATDAALENFKQHWELFRVACDQAEEFVESVKQRIGSECLVDEATGYVAGKPGQAATTGLPPISAVRLEQMSKAVRWLVIELQQGSGTAGGPSHPHSSAPFDARFSEDATQ